MEKSATAVNVVSSQTFHSLKSRLHMQHYYSEIME